MKFLFWLSPGEIAVYCYLLRTEDRQTFQCYPSYEAIGKAVGVSKNTVAKYVRSLEEKGLVNDQPGQGKLDIFTTGSTEEYTMKAAKVGLDPVTSVQFYPPMKL